MEGKQYLVLLASILILSSFGTIKAAWNDDLRGEKSSLIGGGNYVGLQYAITTYSEDGSSDINPTALIARFGTYTTENFSIEGRYGVGLTDDTIAVISGVPINIEIDSIMGLYGVVHSDVSADASFYALLGFSKVDLTATANIPGLGSVSVDNSDSGVSFGAGLDIGRLNIEFIQYLSETDYDFTAISFGGTF